MLYAAEYMSIESGVSCSQADGLRLFCCLLAGIEVDVPVAFDSSLKPEDFT